MLWLPRDRLLTLNQKDDINNVKLKFEESIYEKISFVVNMGKKSVRQTIIELIDFVYADPRFWELG